MDRGKKPKPFPRKRIPRNGKSALVFGTLDAIILFAVAATKIHFEKTGLFVVAILFGILLIAGGVLITAFP